MNKQKLSILSGVYLAALVSSAHAGNWQNSWSSGKGAAAQRCAETFDDYQLQEVCMDNETEGHNKMQGNFWPPKLHSTQSQSSLRKNFR